MSQNKKYLGPEFQFLISSKGSVVVVTFVGEIKNDCLGKLEECQKEVITNETAKLFILNMRDVPKITVDAIPFLTLFQKNIRNKGQLRLCSINPTLKEKLILMGVIRDPEVVNNLQLALKVILGPKTYGD